jgi:hypothetical protein
VPDARAFSVQHHPESSPGPHEGRPPRRRQQRHARQRKLGPDAGLSVEDGGGIGAAFRLRAMAANLSSGSNPVVYRRCRPAVDAGRSARRGW